MSANNARSGTISKNAMIARIARSVKFAKVKIKQRSKVCKNFKLFIECKRCNV